MERHGFGPRTIRLDRHATGTLVVHEVTGAGTSAEYGGRIRRECVPALRDKGIDIDRETVMIFTTLAELDSQKLTFRHRSPYYASGDWRRGSFLSLAHALPRASHPQFSGSLKGFAGEPRGHFSDLTVTPAPRQPPVPRLGPDQRHASGLRGDRPSRPQRRQGLRRPHRLGRSRHGRPVHDRLLGARA